MGELQYSVRYARPDELKTVAGMKRRSWPAWWGKNQKHGIRHIRDRIRSKQVLIAVTRGEIIGYSIFGLIWSEMHFEDFFVKPEYRKSGVGSTLMQKTIGIAKKAGLRKILSDCDFDNKASYKFHLRNGFKKVGYIKRLWGEKDSYVFSKDL